MARLQIFIILIVVSPLEANSQWNGATSTTDYTSLIYRDGNIKANNLGFGRYGGSISGDSNPFSIYSDAGTGEHDLLLFGNNEATLHLRLYDGSIKMGSLTSPNTILYNDGRSYFSNNMGIGASHNSYYKLNITGSTTAMPLHLFKNGSLAGEQVVLQVFSAPGSSGTTVSNVGSIQAKTNGSNAADSYLSIQPINTNGSGWSEGLTIKAGGNVAIGTTDTHGYKLAVAGKAVAEEVVVKLETNWPDYVFNSQYKLLCLSELERFIIYNKHLPDVPTAEHVKENGLSLGEMNAILLKKVEELTLYLIEQNKRIQQLENEQETLRSMIK